MLAPVWVQEQGLVLVLVRVPEWVPEPAMELALGRGSGPVWGTAPGQAWVLARA